MKCPKCGHDNAKGIQFCVKCSGPVGLALGVEQNQKMEPEEKIENKKTYQEENTRYSNMNYKQKNINYQTSFNDTDKYLNQERTKIERKAQKENFKKKFNQASNLGELVIKKIKGFIIVCVAVFVILFFIGVLVDDNYDDTYNYENMDEEIIDAIENENTVVDFDVPEGFSTTVAGIGLSKTYYDDDFLSSISYSLYTGNADVAIKQDKDNYQDEINKKEVYFGNVSQNKITVNGNEVDYLTYKYKNSPKNSSYYTEITGYYQVGNFLYMVRYNDFDSENQIDLNTLFSFEIIETY